MKIKHLNNKDMGVTIIARKGDKGVKVKLVQRLLKVYPDGIFGNLTEEAVKEFQQANNLAADGIVGIKTWTKLLGYCLLPSKRVITEIIVHCTATPEGKDYTIADITRWHKDRGFSTIGYHYVVYRDGSVHEGRNVDVAGAHCTGHNAHSIGVCYVGGLQYIPRVAVSKLPAKDTRTKAQKEALLKLLTKLKTLYPAAQIHGHRDFANKACPSFDATKEYKGI